MKNLKKNNKGFSLVELIVVIAIMAVLGVAVALAVTKFIPQAARSTDISNANMIAEACEVAINDFATSADGKIKSITEGKGTGTKAEYEKKDIFGTTVNLTYLADTGILKSKPTIQGADYKDGETSVELKSTKEFTVYYDEKTGVVNCYIGKTDKTIDLCDTEIAKLYKDGKNPVKATK